MTEQKRLLVMAGGTGGHIFPALAVAQQLQQQGWDICWLGTKDRMEATLVPKYGIPIRFIQIEGIKDRGIKPLLTAPFMILRAIWQAKKIIQNYRPHAVLGMGGYVSGPAGVAAKLCGVPIILHEQNAVAGITNKLLAKIAKKVLQAFPKALAEAEVVGNPVRQALFAQALPEQRFADRTGPLRIFVVGGSQGARVLNLTLPEVAKQLGDRVEIRHQVGQGNVEQVRALYPAETKVALTEFIDDIAEAYAWADLVICRSGALTVSEIAAVGVPAIFIPFQHKDRQQYYNATYLAQAKAAKIIEQPNLTPETLLQELQQLDRQSLAIMAQNAKQQAKPQALQHVAEAIINNAN